MSASLPHDFRHVADGDAQSQHLPAAVSVPVQVAAGGNSHLLPVVESSTGLQFAGVGQQLHHVPSASANVLADAYNSSSSGSSACGEVGCVGSGGCALTMGVPLSAVVTRRMREFIPESKKDDEYWMKRQKNNEAAKRSREKRRANDAVMMRRIHELAVENKRLKLEVEVLRRQLGVVPPTSCESQLLSASAPALVATAATSRSNFEPSRSSVNTGSCHGVLGDQKRWSEEQPQPHVHQSHPSSSCAVAGDWSMTTTLSYVNAPCSTSSVGARTLASLPSYRYSTSGNTLPSIGDLYGTSNGAGGAASYRSVTDGDRRMSVGVDSAPIVIFSDVSSSGDDSVDESWFGKHVHTLTLRRSGDQVGTSGVPESPLNLSTPSRHQSPVRRSYGADGSGLMARRSSVDLGAPCLPVNAASPTVRGADLLSARRASYICDPQGRSTHAADWLAAASRNCSSENAQSRSTSVSSVASVAWQDGLDGVPQPRVNCGLPLKVRRKMGSTSTIMDEAPRPQYDGVWSGEHAPTSRPTSTGAQYPLPTDWFRSSDTERGRTSLNLDVLDRRGDRYE